MKNTPTITELMNVGFVDAGAEYNMPNHAYLYKLEIKECKDILLLRASFDGGWYWSIRNTENEPQDAQSIKRMAQVLTLIDILKGL